MKICFFTDTYYPQINGVVISIDNFAAELRKRGHTVYIFAPRIKGYEDKDPNVYRLPSLKVLSSEPEVRVPLSMPSKSLQAVYSLDFDIVHAHGNGPFSLLGYQVSRLKAVPFVLTFHTLHTRYTHYILRGKVVRPQMVAALLRMFGNVCDGIIAPSEKMKKELLKFRVKKTIEVIPNFITYDRFDIKKDDYLYELLNIPKNAPILLSVGRMGKEKNFKFLIKMFKKLSLKNKDAQLVLVGKGPERIVLQKLAQRLGISDRVYLPGVIEAGLMPKVYAGASMFVFSSTSEVHPVTILEACAAGLPLVVAKDPAFLNAVIDNQNGFELPMDENAFVKAIQILLKDKSLHSKFGKNSRNIVQDNFKADTSIERLLTFYGQVLNNYDPKAKILRKLNRITINRLRRIKHTIAKLPYIT